MLRPARIGALFAGDIFEDTGVAGAMLRSAGVGTRFDDTVLVESAPVSCRGLSCGGCSEVDDVHFERIVLGVGCA
jgi:hypothetical protein